MKNQPVLPSHITPTRGTLAARPRWHLAAPDANAQRTHQHPPLTRRQRSFQYTTFPAHAQHIADHFYKIHPSQLENAGSAAKVALSRS